MPHKDFVEFARQQSRTLKPFWDVRPMNNYHHTQELARMTEELAIIESMNPIQCAIFATEEYGDLLRLHLSEVWWQRRSLECYREVLVRVEAWKPPSRAHEPLKETMLEVIKRKISWAERGSDYNEHHPKRLTGRQWQREQIRALKQEIRAHEKRLKEIERNEKKACDWLDALDASLEALA